MTDTIQIPFTSDEPITLTATDAFGSFEAHVPPIQFVAVPREVHNSWGKCESKELMDRARAYACLCPEAVIQ